MRQFEESLHLFAGREAELAALSGGIEDAVGGHGRLFLISGEPGVGKTTLAGQYAARAIERGVRVLWGRCWEGGGAPAFWPWTQILRPLIEQRPRPESRGAEDVTSLLRALVDGSGTGLDSSSQSGAGRFRLFAAVTDLLKRESSSQPLLLILDDLHAADPVSLLLLRFVARDIRSQHVILVATYRDEEARRRPDVTETLAELGSEGHSIHLRGLDDRTEVQRALEALRFVQPDDAPRCELLLRLGWAQARAGTYQEAKGSFLEAAEIARRLRNAEQLARAALGFGEPQVDGGLVDPQLLELLQEALDLLSPEDSSLRARLLARYSLELTFSEDRWLRETVRQDLSKEALQMARRLGAVAALAFACRARWLAVWGPDGLEERTYLSGEILGLARETGDREMELIGRARRITCLMESGDLEAVDADLAAYSQVAGELRMPYHEWTATTLRSGRALLDGSLGVAQELAEEATSLLAGRQNARLAHLNQITPIRWEQGRLGELRDAWLEIVHLFPQAGFARGWIALSDAEAGREDEARRELPSLVDDILGLPRGGLWLPALAVASLAIARLDDAAAATAIYPLLLPHAGRGIVIPMPHPVVCFGPASLYLALLATAMSRWEEAAGHFESAIQASTRMGARAFLARSQYEYARMLLRRGQAPDREKALTLLDQAEAAASVVGMTVVRSETERLREREVGTSILARQPAVERETGARDRDVFRQEGDYRTIEYEGSVVRLRDSKGLRLIARLIAEPGREFHVIDLEGEQNQGAQGASYPVRQSDSTGLDVRPDLGDAGELLDATAKAEYRTRLQDLETEIEEAEAWADPERAARAREERDFLLAELARAVGLGGRDRRAGSHAERARLNVTRAIKAALANIDKYHPVLGRHLHATIRTGTFCVYSPDPRIPVDWQF